MTTTRKNPNAGRTPEQQALINAKISASRRGKGTGPRNGEIRTCENCGELYPARSRGKRFCSNKCKAAVTSLEYRARKEAEYRANPVQCECGKPISYERRHHAKYCSDDCRKTYGDVGGPKKDPANYVTFNCRNCDKVVTRYKNYGKGHNKYCSNACAQRHTKTRRFYAVEDFDIVFESSWEAFSSLLRHPCRPTRSVLHPGKYLRRSVDFS